MLLPELLVGDRKPLTDHTPYHCDQCDELVESDNVQIFHLTSPYTKEPVTYELCNACSEVFRAKTDSRAGTEEVLGWKGVG